LFSKPIALGEDINKDRFDLIGEVYEEEVVTEVLEYKTGDGSNIEMNETISIVELEETEDGELEVEVIDVQPQTPLEGYYTVQLAAGDVNMSRFSNIEDPMKCKGADGIYRIIAGVFEIKDEATQYLKHLKGLGYKDAWVVKIDKNRINCVR